MKLKNINIDNQTDFDIIKTNFSFKIQKVHLYCPSEDISIFGNNIDDFLYI